jgi:hypothetical protein
LSYHNTRADERLRKELNALGAREFEIVALSMDPLRGHAALEFAINKGAENPVAYAIKIFDNPDWQPSGETKRRATNVAVDVECKTCGGDRFVVVSTRAPMQSPWMKERGITPPADERIEEMAPCPECNAAASTEFRRYDGTMAKTPDPAKTREMMER